MPKSAGSTLSKHIVRNLKKGESVYLENNEDVLLNNKMMKKIKYIHGHSTYYGVHRFFPKREVRYITFLRDPVKRIISQYNYDVGPHKEKTSFQKWYETLIKNEMVHFYSRKFLGKKGTRISIPKFMLPILIKFRFMASPGKMFLSKFILNKYVNLRRGVGKTTKKDFENAKKLLELCWFVGIVGNSEKDLKYIFNKIGVPEKWKNENVSAIRRFTLDKNTIKKIKKENFKDFELYNYAKKLSKKRHP